jgi:sec-independent protein translocase protein TatB
MFDLGWPELMIIVVVALIVIGPKELPNAIRTVMAIMRKMRSLARDFQSSLEDVARESGVDDLKAEFNKMDEGEFDAQIERFAGIDDDLDLPDPNSILDPESDAAMMQGMIDDSMVEDAEAEGAGADDPAKPANDTAPDDDTAPRQASGTTT